MYSGYSIQHCILHTSTFRLQIDFISCVLCIHPSITCIWTFFLVKTTFSKSIILRSKTLLNQMCWKRVIKTLIQNPFAILIINVKSFPIFKRNGAHMVKKKDYSLSRFECFEHVKTFFISVKLWVCILPLGLIFAYLFNK